MSKVVLILGASTVGLGLVSLHLVNQLRQGDATIAELRQQVAALEKESSQVAAPPIFTITPTAPIAATAVVQPVPSNDAPKLAAGVVSGQAVPSQVPPNMPSREDAMRMVREQRERERQLMQDPEYRQAMRLQMRNNLARQYPGVIQELGLDQQQAEEFFGLLADQQMRTSETMQPVIWEPQSGETPDPATVQEQRRKLQQAANELRQNNEAELTALLGPSKTQAWKEYQSTVGMRYQLDHMRSTLEAQGLPLTDELTKPMLKALAAAQKAELEARNAAARQAASGTPGLVATLAADGNNMEWHLEQTKKRNQRMLDAISSYLTYEQRTAIEREQQAQVKLQEAQMRIMRERGGANATRRFYSTGGAQLTPLQP